MASDERTPLIADRRGRANVSDHVHGAQRAASVEALVPLKLKDVVANMGLLIPYAWPVSAGYLLWMSVNLASAYTLAWKDTTALAAMTLASLFCNVTGFSLGIGIAAGLDTLCSQCYGEFQRGKAPVIELGRHLQRGVLVMSIMCIPILVLWCFAEDVLKLTGQDVEVAHLAGRLVRCMMPGLWPAFLSEAIKRFLQSQGIMNASLIVLSVVAPMNLVLQYVFVVRDVIGVEGAAISVSICNILICVGMVVYTAWSRGRQGWGGIEVAELLRWDQIWLFITLGVPDILMTASEWWAFEFVSLASGLVSREALAAQSILFNTSALTYMLPLGVSIATTTRVGNALGAGLSHSAKLAALGALLLGLVTSSVNSTFFLAVKDSWGGFWTDDKGVVSLVSAVLPLVAVFQFSDGSNAIVGGVLRGIGRQNLGALILMLGYWGVGLPLGLYACFRLNWGLFGLWSGLTIALMLTSVGQCVIVARTDWVREAQLAHDRVGVTADEEEAEGGPQ